MKRISYKKFLFFAAAALSFLSLVMIWYAGLRIHPAYSFLGLLTAEEKLNALNRCVFPSAISALCMLLLNFEAQKISRATLTLLGICAILSIAGLVLFGLQEPYRASYQIAALILYALPAAFLSLLSDLVSLAKPKFKYANAALYTVLTVLLLIYGSASILTAAGSVLQLPFMMYILPLTSIPAAFLLFLRKTSENFPLTLRSVIAVYALTAVFVLFHFMAPYRAELAVRICGFAVLGGTGVSALSVIYDIIKKGDNKNGKL